MGCYSAVSVLLLVVCSYSNAFVWSTDFKDGAELYACVGDTVMFPWNFAIAHGQMMEDIKWYFQREGFPRQSVAGTIDGTFFPLPAFAHRVDHVTSAGIQLKNVTDADTGNYSVVVTVLNGVTYSTFQHTSTLTVAAESLVTKRTSELLLQQQRIAVFDNNTRQFHVQLTFGNFRITGHPPVVVEFTNPSGWKEIVSVHNGGNFSVLLPNPVEGGTYSCHLLADYPPVSCLPANSNVLPSVTVSIDEVRARMSLIEAEQRALQVDDDQLRKDLAEIIHNETLSNQLLHEKALNHVSFHVQLSRDVTVSSSRPLLFDRIVNNKGSAYSALTGRFTAPLSGTYFFAATCAPTNSTVTCYIQAAGTRVCVTRAHYGRLSSDSISHQWAATCHASLRLARGAEVWVGAETTASFNGSYTSFNGFSVDLE